jgi:hypothetical protein
MLSLFPYLPRYGLLVEVENSLPEILIPQGLFNGDWENSNLG